MTDNEIIKAYVSTLKEYEGTINRLQAENEKRKNKICNHRAIITDLMLKNKELKRDCEHLHTMVAARGLEINRLQTEINLLTEKSIEAKYPHCVLCGNGAILTKDLAEYDRLIADIKAEAYKEFFQLLHKKLTNTSNSFFECKNLKACEVLQEAIDKLREIYKEKVGEDNSEQVDK